MNPEEIFSVEPDSETNYFSHLSVRKNFNNNITAAVCSQYQEIVVFEIFPEDSFAEPVEQRSFSDLREINGLSLSPDASRLFYSGGENWFVSGYFDLTTDSRLSPACLPKREEPMGICSYNPAMDLVATTYWNDDNKMNIRFLSFDADSGSYISRPEHPELTGPVGGYYLIHSLSWSNDGTLLMITTGEVDDGIEGTNGSVEIIDMSGPGDNRQCLYINFFSQSIGASCFNHDKSIAAFCFDDKIRFIDVTEGKVLSTRRKVNAEDICFYNNNSTEKIFYAEYSVLRCLDLKTLKDCFHREFDDNIKRLELIPASGSGFSYDLLFILFSSGRLSILRL